MLKIIALTIALAVRLWAAPEPRTLICNFDGENSSKVYRVFTSVGVGTTFRLPEGWKITDFVVTDPRSFHAESNGTIGIVTPLVANKATSVSIFTENDRLFVFSLSSEPSETSDQLVIVQANNLQFFSSKVKAEAQKLTKERLEAVQTQCDVSTDQKLQQLKRQLLFSLNSKYDVKDEKFSVTRVVDDHVFTYIQLAKSQNRPAVYIGKTADPKKLEPVKYTDEGDYYAVHRILDASERLYLKLGEDSSEIRRR